MKRIRANTALSDKEPLHEAVSRDILLAEVRVWARRIGVEDRIHEVHIRPMKRKWASVSTRGRLTLSEDLLRQPSTFRREVIVHELVHIKLNQEKHTKFFRSLVRAYLSGAEKAPENRTM